MGRAGVSRTNIPFFLPPYTLVSLFFISFFFSFSFFLRHPCRRCRFPSSPDLEQIRGHSIRRISTSRPVPLRVNNCILLQKFLFFFPTVLKISRRRKEAARFETLFFQVVVFIFKRARGIWIVVSRSNPTTTTTTLLQILVAKWMQVQARAKNTFQSIQSSERYVKN